MSKNCLTANGEKKCFSMKDYGGDEFLAEMMIVGNCMFFFLVSLFQVLFSGYTSATFSCAFLNMVPVFTFIMAVPFGIEKVNMQSKSGKAKVMGTFVCIGGALLLVLYKGMPLVNQQSQHVAIKITSTPLTAKLEKWIIGGNLPGKVDLFNLSYDFPPFLHSIAPNVSLSAISSIAGSAMVIAGMYIVLWGKSKEE
ncbi:hypothetical protein Fmac_023000 [Flemingia macrophylla]|uniref:WAT1-related protein n=1 Tax=Flemingia macrophylla TaxID=520843 RepID=A0ABD1LKB0_9FABA